MANDVANSTSRIRQVTPQKTNEALSSAHLRSDSLMGWQSAPKKRLPAAGFPKEHLPALLGHQEVINGTHRNIGSNDRNGNDSIHITNVSSNTDGFSSTMNRFDS